MILPASYANGFAPRDGQPLYPELWRGCVGAWAPCLGPTGLTLRDWSGRANHGTLTNMDAAGDWVPSSGRYALDFDGTNDHVVVSASSLFATSGGTNWSVSGWALIRSAAAAQVVVCRGLNGSSQRDYMIYYAEANTRFELQNSNGATFPTINSGTGTVAKNTWYHVAGTCNLAGTAILYLNGIQRSTGTLLTIVPTNNSRSVTFGAALDSPTTQYYADAQLDDLRVYNRVLSAFEIQLLASRRGIAYEMAPRRRSSLVAGFNRRRRLLVGAGS